jgi:hypothetical protein
MLPTGAARALKRRYASPRFVPCSTPGRGRRVSGIRSNVPSHMSTGPRRITSMLMSPATCHQRHRVGSFLLNGAPQRNRSAESAMHDGSAVRARTFIFSFVSSLRCMRRAMILSSVGARNLTWYTRPLTGSMRRPSTRSVTISSGTSRWMTKRTRIPTSDRSCACLHVRGNPSSRTPRPTASGSCNRSCRTCASPRNEPANP